ncbi:MAG: hypothetical protein A3B74_00645 [Candidatus Kerfeldbacteria bacterium RIFCSPHIGHO2_02_FULL_42_14]|uniref:ATP-grasp domain-containing protein n=1 Tax=Candidatus Kerfeldbacteria bacterium RIFCSPHIGHO2_02_FULL_42_14 TaxID=1798540 RepID=A0A1G2ATJ0_9BACT|nr:MAG: hypothetical protein A3B74_00645 [Candidatus Kerfeldbacteria bacterium RIFCSPHIGHO2_02_FULL_42_14]OGY81451.1 MAG: hypothetical protein A3E60_05500 [Candidatus Kerfeldbacteria bacterium RIFCSPHIGHO2_12_FULL_42_13]OGY83498.1 MAG: hypothetical protein A3I91_02530 [Candidatus Kerfeldbacteria bacterium RIFCSPLOWO2_02_FULL_42_19]OGY86976.1 MAG: hypothetical protein A3G01_01680 [Candidatus Kerfeldbacteria bacterium RIFCSPLOWO2_12_FULL_43_9]
MKQVRILLTSVGVETGPNVINALKKSSDFTPYIIGTDNDPLAAGLYLCDEKVIAPRIDTPDYMSHLMQVCHTYRVDIIIPLLSKEMPFFASASQLLKEKAGIKIAISDPKTIQLCADKNLFVKFLIDHNIPAPRAFDEQDIKETDFPLFVKPITGSSSRYAIRVNSLADLEYIKRIAGPLSIQELLTGPEYTVDTLCDLEGTLVTAVIRERLEVKDGKAVKGRTVKDDDLIQLIKNLVSYVKIIGPSNIQCIKNQGIYTFFEINTRFSAGGLPLTVVAGVNLPALLVKIHLGMEIHPEELLYRENVYMSRYLTEVFPQPVRNLL